MSLQPNAPTAAPANHAKPPPYFSVPAAFLFFSTIDFQGIVHISHNALIFALQQGYNTARFLHEIRLHEELLRRSS